MDFGSIFSNTAAYLFSPVTLAYALAATGLAVHFGYAAVSYTHLTLPTIYSV